MITAAEDRKIPVGYKQTEVGVIPVDWEVRKLGERSGFRTGPFGSALHKSDYTDDGVPVINPMHIIDGQIVPTRTMTVTDAAAKHLAEYQLKAGDIIMGRRGDMGRCAVVHSNQAGWLCGTGSIIIRSEVSVAPDFLQRVLSCPRAVAAIEDTSVGSTMTNLNQSTLAGLRIQFPPLPEQRAIAETLSDADALIDGLDKLIAKKRAVKQGAMQELLTGKRRLPGFSEEWEVKKIGDMFRVTRGQVLAMTKTTTDRIGEYQYPVYSSQTKENGLAGYYNDYLFENSITWTTDGANAGDVKYRSGKFYCTNVCGVLESHEGYSNLCIAEIFNSVSKKYVSYVGNPKLMNNVVAEIKIIIPNSIDEQIAIASVLSDMDTEIEALEYKLAKYRSLKQGMMQVLLTGKIRLPH